MSWIKQHSDILTHQKLYRLAALLGINRFEALGYVSGLWHFTAMNWWQNGDIGDFIHTIEPMLEWRGESGKLVKSLQESGLLDGSVVHEWTIHQAEFIRLKQRYGSATSGESRTKDELKPTKAVTDKIREDKINNKQPMPKPAASVSDFDAFWQSYPRKVGKDKALDAWKKKNPPLEAVLGALAWQIQSDDWRKDGGAFIPHPTTYLNQGRWKDEPKCNHTQQAPKAPLKPMTAREKAIYSGEWEKMTPEQREAILEAEA